MSRRNRRQLFEIPTEPTHIESRSSSPTPRTLDFILPDSSNLSESVPTRLFTISSTEESDLENTASLGTRRRRTAQTDSTRNTRVCRGISACGNERGPEDADSIIRRRSLEATNAGVSEAGGYEDSHAGVQVDLSSYWQCCQSDSGVLRLDHTTFIVQEWDSYSCSLKPEKFNHVRYLPVGANEVSFTCDCPAPSPCHHTQLLLQHIGDALALQPLSSIQHPPAFLLAETALPERYVFSVRGTSQSGSTGGKRTLVYLLRGGGWRCRSCTARGTCHHKEMAQEYAKNADIIDCDGILHDNTEGLPDLSEIRDENQGSNGNFIKQPVSHLFIPVPSWCRLPRDITDYATPPPETPPEIIPLDEAARCCCGQQMPLDRPIRRYYQTFTVLGLRRAYISSIEVADCLVCSHRSRQYGPDCRDLGIFNWNNTIGFSHELLNQYSNVFTTAPTPFASFATSTQRLYVSSSSPAPFCALETFTKAWFAFTDLQILDSRMECPTCGKHPEIVIADGVSIGYSSAKFVQGLQPPSLINDLSPKTHSVRGPPGCPRAAISSVQLRKELRELTATKSPPVNCMISEQRRNDVPAVTALVSLYSRTSIGPFQAAVRELIRQIAADDIILILVPYPAISILAQFSSTSTAPPHLPLWVPALGNIILSLSESSIPSEVVHIAGWLAKRAATVYESLSQHDYPMPDPSIPQGDWRETGVCYSSPRIRVRPHYPSLAGDGLTEDKLEKEEFECGKYYSTYKKAGLTGGLMVLWCRHSVCLGFHTIPTTEGRNDVFSALYSYWPVAPKVVVYDFSCSLAPYSWVREAKFFRETRFVVDQFHASGHTKCSRAASATFAMQYDPNMQAVNTSAAEIGNSGTGKIRKSVSYMTQRHAIQYTKVYMDITNRCRSIKITTTDKVDRRRRY